MVVDLKKIQTIAENYVEVQKRLITSSLLGRYRDFKSARIESASITAKNFEVVKNIKLPEIKVPIFSRVGWNMIKVAFMDMFRFKTANEKIAKRLRADEAIKKKYLDKWG